LSSEDLLFVVHYDYLQTDHM